jgi:spermidine synthase
MASFTEKLYDSYGQAFIIDTVYHQEQTDHQDLLIFHNAQFGTIMALDGVVQTTERDEFIYHEMLTHVPLCAHGAAQKILIIGGGDGGILREVTRHIDVEHITQVEIDGRVVELSTQYLPNHSQGAYRDPRVRLIIGDGLHFLRTCQEHFDIIISDCTDPTGPGAALFSAEFYRLGQTCLAENGILVAQNGVPYLQLPELITTAQHLSTLFADWHFYSAAIPTYIGGIMTFAFASNHLAARKVSLNELTQRWKKLGLTTKYYNPEIHLASFVLPQYVLTGIGKNNNAD